MNEFKIKNGLTINDTLLITGITNSSGLTNDSNSIVTSSAVKLYSDSKLSVSGISDGYILFNSGNTLSGTSNLTFNSSTKSLSINGDIQTSSCGISNLGGYYINLINKTGSPTVKGMLVTYYAAPDFFDNYVKSIKNFDTNKILVGGYFTKYKDITSNNIVKIDNNYDIDTSLTTNVYGGIMNDVVIQSDNKILLNGDISKYNNDDRYNYKNRNYILNVNINGYEGTGFTSGFTNLDGFNGPIYAMVQQSDGKILVGGDFSQYSGSSKNCLVRLNSNGTIDTSFNVGTGFNGAVNTIAIQQSDGKIYVGGAFTNYNGGYQYYITRLSSTGTRDNTFIAASKGFNSNVYSIAIQSGGTLLVGGFFKQYTSGTSTTTCNRIIGLNTNGTVNSSFVIGTGFQNTWPYISTGVYVIKNDSNNNVLVGGEFDKYDGTIVRRIARLSYNGVLDSGFTSYSKGIDDSDTGTVSRPVHDISIQTDGKILLSGIFYGYHNTPVKKIFRLNTSGTIDTSFNSDLNYDSKLCLQTDGNILVGCSDQYYIYRLDSGGTLDTTFHVNDEAGVNGNVYKIIELSNGTYLIGGGFTKFDGSRISNFVRLNSGGTLDTSLNLYYSFADGGYVNTSVVLSDGSIILGGRFGFFNRTIKNYIVKLNSGGTIDTGFTIGDGFNEEVYTIAVQPSDGRILVGGNFTSYSGVTANRIIRLNTNGTIDNSFNNGTGFTDYVTKIVVQSDNNILVGGGFIQYSGVSRNYIIRLTPTGSIDSSFVIGTGFNGSVHSIKIQSDNKILIGGVFTSYNGTSSNRFIRLNVNGSVDSSLNVGNGLDGLVYTIEEKPSGNIVLGGAFKVYDQYSTQYIVEIDTNGTAINTFYASNSGFKYYPAGTSLNNTPYIGVTLDSGVADSGVSSIVIAGVCEVKLCATSSGVTIGDKLSTYVSVSDGEIGRDESSSPNVYFGRALENGSAGDTIKCLMFCKDKQDPNIY